MHEVGYVSSDYCTPYITEEIAPMVYAIIIIIIIASHEDEMNDKYNDKLCASNEVIQ